MNTTRAVTLLTCLVMLTASCASKKEEKPTPEPVKKPPVHRTTPPAPVADVHPTDMYRTPDGDMNLPTSSQLADGEASSIGAGVTPITNPDDNSPSASITPSSPPRKTTPPEDELAPAPPE